MGVAIKSIGHFIPETRITNVELGARLNMDSDVIAEKTGILERRIFNEGATSDMIVNAAKICLSACGMDVLDVECIIVATMTADFPCPSTAAVVHHKLGTKNAWGFDAMAACSGFLYGFEIGSALLNSRQYKNVLLCAADKMTSIIDPMDKKTSLIFGDGAGVVLLEHTDDEHNEIIDTICKLDSTDLMSVSACDGGSKNPITPETLVNTNHFMKFTSRGIFSGGIALFKEVILEVMGKNHLTFDDIDYIVPHQANKRMLEGLAAELNLPISKFIINIEHIGNTNSGSIPIALSEAIADGRIRQGMKIIVAGVGAGFTYGASIISIKQPIIHAYT
ncbi:ketoacyl-ACP synthase III [uncultured Mucilaginibacter sp.]|uniref:3-oxoacyl-ACP synthase III family protein n=1 Tax=uncultured Mucilaginibacter sp. TaxID=797541 RepID=UPI0025D72572|nr:ketoacyl-ACP synthase III [uncultured Mucilaginibacter sp.]